MFLSHKEYRNYKITNITLSEIVIKDSLLNLRKGNRYFLLEFMVDYCNSSLTFMGGGVEPGLNGTIESIKSIKIIDSNGNDISSLFHNLTIEDNDLWLVTTQHPYRSEYLELYPVIGYIDSCQYSEEFNQYLFTGYYVFYHYGTKKAIKLVDWLSR